MMVKLFLDGRIEIEELFSKSDILTNIERTHHPFLIFKVSENSIEVKIFKSVKKLVYSNFSEDTKIMVQWVGKWRSDFFQLTMGELRKAYETKYNIKIKKEYFEYEEDTGMKAIYGGKETKGFQKWHERKNGNLYYQRKNRDLYSQYIQETGKSPLWGDKETIAFQKWLKQKTNEVKQIEKE